MSGWNVETMENQSQSQNSLPSSPMVQRPKTLTLNLGGGHGQGMSVTPTRGYMTVTAASPSGHSPMATRLLSGKVKRKAEEKDLKAFLAETEWELAGSPAKEFMVDWEAAGTVLDEHGFLNDWTVEQGDAWTEEWKREQSVVEMEEDPDTDMSLHNDWRAPGTPLGTPGDKPKKFAARKFGTPAATPTTPTPAADPMPFFGYAWPSGFPPPPV